MEGIMSNDQGSLWDGRYRLGRTLGEGGMGRVVYGRDTKEGDREVAIKMLLPEFSWSTAAFEEEYRRMGLLDHPHIPKVYNFGFAPNSLRLGGQIPYFVMEYCPGVELKRLIRQAERDVRRFLRWMIMVCDALHYVHSCGLLHRDLKPENVIVDNAADMVNLIDFGVASVVRDPLEYCFIGTPEYAAPELLGETERCDERTDLYAVGLVLYEIVTGRKPWSGSDEHELYVKRMEVAYSSIQNECPDGLKRLIDDLLRPRMADRPRSAREVAERLESIVRDAKG